LELKLHLCYYQNRF